MQNLQRYAPQMKEIQKKYKSDKQKQNEELMKFYRENQINPAASCLPMLAQFPVFIALYYALRNFSNEPASQHPGEPLVPALHPVDRGPHDVALGRLRAARRLRRVARWRRRSTCRRPSTRRSAIDLHAHAARLRVRDRALPGRPRPLLGDDEPLDGRAGADHAAARAEDAASASSRRRARRTPPKDDGSSGNGAKPRARRAEARAGAVAAAAAQGARGRRRPGGGERATLTVEATGETVGEAKWAALRELELRHPGLDKSAVRFEVVAEGERGLLGVGYEPARVLAHLPAEAAGGGRRRRERAGGRGARCSSRACSTRSASRAGSTCTRTTTR